MLAFHGTNMIFNELYMFIQLPGEYLVFLWLSCVHDLVILILFVPLELKN